MSNVVQSILTGDSITLDDLYPPPAPDNALVRHISLIRLEELNKLVFILKFFFKFDLCITFLGFLF